ncbi:MAG: diguanylate cyclase [Oscillatoriales cyanobacterium]|nr:MAG: diguanylate cyclase [Oscillatoriales cyanobacterium]
MLKIFPALFNRSKRDRPQPPSRPPEWLSPQQSWQLVLLSLAIALVYSLCATISLEFISLPGKIASVWLPSGLTLALFFRWRSRSWPGIVIGSMFGLIRLWTDWEHGFGNFILFNLICTLGNCVQPWAAHWFVSRYGNVRQPFIDLRSSLIFILAAWISPTLSATLGITFACWIGTIPWPQYWICWVSWWLASALAHLIFSPPMLLFKKYYWSNRRRYIQQYGWDLIGIGLATIVVTLTDFVHGYPVAYILFASLIWSVFRLGNWPSSCLVAIVSVGAIIATVTGNGSFADRSMNESIILLQSFMGILSIAGLVLSATVQERKAAQHSLEATLQTLEVRIAERTAELAQTEAQLSGFFSSSSIGMGIVDDEMCYLRINQVLADINCLPVQDHLGKRVQDVIPELASELIPYFQAVFSSGLPQLSKETSREIPQHSGVIRTWLSSYFPIFDRDRQLFRVGFVVMDITDRKRLEHQLEQQARIDGLTQIANRRHFDEALDRAWRQCIYSQQSMALVLCDADHFKRYNDTYGHPMGDRCLVQIAEVLRETLRHPTDLAARYGGEEFAVLLPSASLHQALLVANAIRDRIRARAIPHEGSLVSDRVTLSIGVAVGIPRPPKSAADFVDQADRALYKAKQQGRNRVVALDDSAPALPQWPHA